MKIIAFLKKDLLITISYRFQVALDLVRMSVSLLMLYFIGKTFSGSLSPYLKQYGGDYFSYVLVGIALSSFVSVGLDALSGEIRAAQMEGTLEALLSTPTSIYTILFGNSLWSFIEAAIGSMLILTVGILFLGLSIPAVNLLAALLVVILTLMAFITVGMLSASFIMIFKQGNPIPMIFGSSSYFLGGILFPVEVLPVPLQHMSKVLPITHALAALRDLLLAQKNLYDIIPQARNLVIFVLLLAPVSIFFFRYAVKRAKRDGSLIQY